MMTDAELADLCRAKTLLENPGLAARLANVVGSPIEKGFKMLPAGWSETVQKATYSALLKALKFAVITLEKQKTGPSADLLHKILVGTSGGIGGAFGLVLLPLELPVSTAIMLRSIADIARSEGQNVSALETKLACLEVFALGGKTPGDDSTENGYWAVRAALAKAVSEAAAYLTQRGLAEETAPAIVRLISAVASRFGVVVSEQVAARTIPVAGAVAGSSLNVLFMAHFQKMARGHFTIRRLEAKYGTAEVQDIYRSIALKIAAPANP